MNRKQQAKHGVHCEEDWNDVSTIDTEAYWVSKVGLMQESGTEPTAPDQDMFAGVMPAAWVFIHTSRADLLTCLSCGGCCLRMAQWLLASSKHGRQEHQQGTAAQWQVPRWQLAGHAAAPQPTPRDSPTLHDRLISHC